MYEQSPYKATEDWEMYLCVGLATSEAGRDCQTKLSLFIMTVSTSF